MDYHNTTPITGKELADSKAKAKNQDQVIFEYFQANQGQEFTPGEVWEALGGKAFAAPSSMSRALNTLTRAGKLGMTGNKRVGDYGKPVNTWRLKTGKPIQTSLF